MEFQTDTAQKLPIIKVIAAAVVVLVVVTGVLYLIKGRNSESISEEKNKQNSEETSSQPPGMAVILDEQNGSGQSGIAAIAQKDDKVVVSLGVSDVAGDVVLLAHIHKGSCTNAGEVKYPLNNLVEGNSETNLETTINNLRSELPLSIDVHKSISEDDTPIACGELK